MKSKLLGCVLVAVVAGACGGVGKRRVPLIDSLRDYNESLRWERFDQAALSVPVLEREDFLDERDDLAEDLEIDDVEVKRMRFRRNRTWARVDVEYTWHLDSRGLVYRTTARQIWELDGKFWLITGETRVRGEPMPGLADPEPDEDVESEEVSHKTGPDPRITQ